MSKKTIKSNFFGDREKYWTFCKFLRTEDSWPRNSRIFEKTDICRLTDRKANNICFYRFKSILDSPTRSVLEVNEKKTNKIKRNFPIIVRLADITRRQKLPWRTTNVMTSRCGGIFFDIRNRKPWTDIEMNWLKPQFFFFFFSYSWDILPTVLVQKYRVEYRFRMKKKTPTFPIYDTGLCRC